MPGGWAPEPTPELEDARAFVRSIGGDPDNETAKFTADARARGVKRQDFTSALVKWLRGTNPPPAARDAITRASRDRERPVGRVEPLSPEHYPSGTIDMETGQVIQLVQTNRAAAANPAAAAPSPNPSPNPKQGTGTW